MVEGEIEPEPSARRGRLFVLAAAMLWSVSGVATKSIDLDSGSIAFYRSLFAGLSLLAFVPRRRIVFRPVMLPLIAVFGAMIGLYIGAVKATSAANAIFLQCSATFWVVPMSALILKERPDRRSLAGVALAMVGVLAILVFGHHGTTGEWQGVAMGLASGVAYAAVVTGMRGLRDLDPVWLSAVNNLGGALCLGLWLATVSAGVARPSGGEALALLLFGVIQMAIPYAIFAKGLKTVDAAEAGLIGLVEPILNMTWVALIVGEVPRGPTLIGGIFLLLGVACRYWPRRRLATG